MNPYESPQGLDEPKPFPLLWLAKEAGMGLVIALLTLPLAIGGALLFPAVCAWLVYGSLTEAARTRSPLDCFVAVFFSVVCVVGTALWTLIVADIFFGCTFSNPW